MRASKAVKLTDKVLDIIKAYAFVAQEWEVTDEDDFSEFKDELLDTIASMEDE